VTRGSWPRRAASILGVLLAVLAAAVLVGEVRWRLRTRALRAELGAGAAGDAAVFDPRTIEPLPSPVRRYLERALRPGQPLVRRARLTMEGDFLADEKTRVWSPFTAEQLVVARPPGFVWSARILAAPGVSVLVHDAYRKGAGLLRAEALGLVPVASQADTPDLARGELLRWLAETAWVPTALLPGGAVTWEAIDEERARATVTDRGTTASVEMRFGADRLVASVFASDRPRTVGGQNVPTPWEGTWTAFGPRNGMRVPSAGEVAWLLPDGRLAYWRGRVRSIVYDFAGN
jgi:hypothetical protein